MTSFVRALLWIIMIVAPGGVFLLPLLVGDAVARRKRQESAGGAAQGRQATAPVVTADARVAAAPCSGPPC